MCLTAFVAVATPTVNRYGEVALHNAGPPSIELFLADARDLLEPQCASLDTEDVELMLDMAVLGV